MSVQGFRAPSTTREALAEGARRMQQTAAYRPVFTLGSALRDEEGFGDSGNRGCDPRRYRNDDDVLRRWIVERCHRRALPGLRIRLRREFAALRACYDACEDAGLAIDTLSMGMSADLELAIAEGSTEVRIGTAIFGERERPAAARPA